MAEASIKYCKRVVEKVVEKVVKETVEELDKIVLELSKEEVTLILAFVGKSIGSDHSSTRKYANQIYDALSKTIPNYYNKLKFNYNSPFICHSGYFDHKDNNLEEFDKCVKQLFGQ